MKIEHKKNEIRFIRLDEKANSKCKYYIPNVLVITQGNCYNSIGYFFEKSLYREMRQRAQEFYDDMKIRGYKIDNRITDDNKGMSVQSIKELFKQYEYSIYAWGHFGHGNDAMGFELVGGTKLPGALYTAKHKMSFAIAYSCFGALWTQNNGWPSIIASGGSYWGFPKQVHSSWFADGTINPRWIYRLKRYKIK